MHACMSDCVCLCMHAWMFACKYVGYNYMNVCTYVCIHAFLFVYTRMQALHLYKPVRPTLYSHLTDWHHLENKHVSYYDNPHQCPLPILLMQRLNQPDSFWSKV